MSKIGIILLFPLFSLLACTQKSNKHQIDPAAVKLNYMAMDLNFRIKDSASKAITFLDSATAIDSNYFFGYYDKLMFLIELKEYDRAIVAINNLLRLNPNRQDFYFLGGIFYEKIDDSVSSNSYFQKSLAICSKVLDTMKIENENYDMLVTNKAMNLIMLGEQLKGNLLLKQVYEGQRDSLKKEFMHSFIDKSKCELIEMITTSPAADSATSTAVDVK